MDLHATGDCVRPPRWLILLWKQLFSLHNIVRVRTYPQVERATGASYRGTMTPVIRRKLAMVGECSSNAPTILEVAIAQAAHLWRSFERQQITLLYDNCRRYISGVEPHNPYKSLNVNAVAVCCTLLSCHNT